MDENKLVYAKVVVPVYHLLTLDLDHVVHSRYRQAENDWG